MSKPASSPSSSSASSSASSSRRPFSLSRLRRLAVKELREILRDRRTIITLVLMPLLVYPLLGIAFKKFMLSSVTKPQEEVVYRVVFESEKDAQLFKKILEDADRWENLKNRRKKQKKKNGNGNKRPDLANTKNGRQNSSNEESKDDESTDDTIGGAESGQPLIRLGTVGASSDIEAAVASGHFDIGIRIVRYEGRARPPLLAKKYEFILADRSQASSDAHEYILGRLRYLQDQWTKEITEFQIPRLLENPDVRERALRLRLFGLSGRASEFTETSVKATSGPTSFLSFFPLMLVLMTITGAVYPAIDLTAGERERGTMEILISAPVSRMALLAAKFVAVLAVAMLTAIFNMIAMCVTVYTVGIDTIVFGENGLSIGVVCQLLLLLFVFAGFFSAVLLGLTSFARSFKEAQAYLIPLMLIALAPGMVSLLPGIELNLWLAVVPLINIVLLGRDLLLGDFNGLLWGISLVSTMLYGILALSFAAKVFGTDAILSGGSGSWSSMFRRSSQNESTPTLALGVLSLAILFPAFIVIGGLANRYGSQEIRQTIESQSAVAEAPVQLDVSEEQLTRMVIFKSFFNGLVLLGLFVVFPFAVSMFYQLRLRSTFYLELPRMFAWGGAILLGLSAWIVVYEIEILSLTSSRIEELTRLFGQLDISLSRTPLWIKLLCLAVAPAVCEELFFRGFLLSAVRQSTSTITAIFATAVAFGLFHVFIGESLFFERFIPSTLLGLLLAYICVRTGSIFPGMLLHVLHNGFLITLSNYEAQLTAWGIGTSEQEHLPVWLIAAAGIPYVIGFALIYFSKKKSTSLLSKPEMADIR